MTETMIAVIGGSGLYEIDGLEDARWQEIQTPWGAPSDNILTARDPILLDDNTHPIAEYWLVKLDKPLLFLVVLFFQACLEFTVSCPTPITVLEHTVIKSEFLDKFR